MLDRKSFDCYISEVYKVTADFPWVQYPDFGVYRHGDNKKWFAVVMNIPKSKLKLSGDECIDVVNLKCDPILIGSLLKDEGIFPGYHMNKAYWITVLLDGSVEADKLKWLLDISFKLTDKIKK